MINRIKVWGLLCFTTIVGCQPKPSISGARKVKSQVALADPLRNFKQFIGKFHMLKLPIELDLDQLQAVDSLPVMGEKDMTFIHVDNTMPDLNKQYAYGLIPDTINCFKVIVLKPAEEYIPVLITYSKSGKKLSEKEFAVGQCGSQPCFLCREVSRIETDLTLRSADSITVTDCESAGNAQNIIEKYVLVKQGKITSSGKIVLSKIRRITTSR